MAKNRHISKRSYEKITKADLKKLLKFAHEDRNKFFLRHPRWKRLYSDRIICIALCQGAALHYLNGKNGVKDFDVFTFYSEHSSAPYPYRRMGHLDFGISKFGCHPDDIKKFNGRCVDLIGRSSKCSKNAEPVKALHEYLSIPKTNTATELSQKAVVLLYPDKYFGKVVWP